MSINFEAALEPQTPPPGPPQVPEVVEPEVVPAAGLDLVPVKQFLTPYQSLPAEWLSRAQALVVNSDESLGEAVALAATAKKLYKKLEDARKRAVEAPNAFVKSANSLFKAPQEVLSRVEKTLGAKVVAFQQALELERRRQEKAAQEEHARLEAQIKAEAAAAGVEAPEITAPVVPVVPTVTRTEEGTASLVHTWTFEVEAVALVPRDYLMVDEKAIRAAVKAGIREIPGVRIFEQVSTRVRA